MGRGLSVCLCCKGEERRRKVVAMAEDKRGVEGGEGAGEESGAVVAVSADGKALVGGSRGKKSATNDEDSEESKGFLCFFIPKSLFSCKLRRKDEFKMSKAERTMKAAILIQQWYRRYLARMEVRRRCTWNIFQSIEYAGEQDQMKLYNFFNALLTHMPAACNVSSGEVMPGNGTWRRGQKPEEDDEAEDKFPLIDPTYKGPHVSSPLIRADLDTLIQAFTKKKVYPLHPRYVASIVREATARLKVLPNLNQASTALSRQVTICGDIHGKLDDLLIVLHKNGLPSAENPYVFNGDFVDRGKRSIEVLIILLTCFLLFPGAVYLNRGNHEDHIINLRYGFVREMRTKYRQHADRLLVLIERMYRWLPLGTLVDNKVFVVHGGISDVTDLTVIRNAERQKYVSLLRTPITDSSVHSEPEKENKDTGPEDEETPPTVDKEEWKQVFDILWSDPTPNEGCEPNTLRGAGTYFGPDVTEQFLEKHGLSLLVRSHECKLDGYEMVHGDKVITIFSASNYYEVGSNKGAYLKLLGPELTPHFVQYTSAASTGGYGRSSKKGGFVVAGATADGEEPQGRQLTFRQRVGLVERSAIRELRGRILTKQDSLMEEFRKTDPAGTGYIPVSSWCSALEKKTGLSVPWRMLRDRLASIDYASGFVEYNSTFREDGKIQRRGSGTTLVDTLYRNKSSLEAIFKIIDKDNSGLISMEEFKEAWILLSNHLEAERASAPEGIPMGMAPSPSLHQMLDVARTMDLNKDGLIDLNEFMEAFRLVDPGRGSMEDTEDESDKEDGGGD
ncbi:serine/threonine-protein phosphatase rdgC [Ischnura elegans]|uniref:serine/threonine-protein phosphatase rdgC n=1 Tax=Ischnura elegans TaxID=197161 RepID=UPI001ED8BC73|nr:serine/threonine-protein phosphatase rdgC [Ischnura elegans]